MCFMSLLFSFKVIIRALALLEGLGEN